MFSNILNGFRVASFDASAARMYGPIRARLEKHGLRIGPYDLMIAAHALSLKAILVTDNVGEFSCVDDLPIENWIA